MTNTELMSVSYNVVVDIVFRTTSTVSRVCVIKIIGGVYINIIIPENKTKKYVSLTSAEY